VEILLLSAGWTALALAYDYQSLCVYVK